MLLKYEIFDHPGPVNHKNLAKSMNYSHIKNFAQMWGFDHPGLGSCESSKLGKINKFESCWKFCWNLSFLTTVALQNMKIGKIKKFEKIWLNFRFLTTQDLGNMKFGQINQFESQWKYCLNLWFLTTLVLQNMKFSKIKKFELHWKFDSNQRFFDHPGLNLKHEIWQNKLIWVMLKILHKFEIFDHPGPVKHEIWQNL